MDAKKIAIPVILVLGLGVSIYLGTRFLGSDDDPNLMSQVSEFTCSSCGATFSRTVAQSRDQLRQHGAILCPQCGESGATQQSAKVTVGFTENGDRSTTQEEVQDPEPIPGGGIMPVGG